jgi:hypothetical protein
MKFTHLPVTVTLISVAAVVLPSAANAATLSISFTKLTGLTGGSPASTAIYRADLTNLGFDLNSVSIGDDSGGLGGSPGKFSGFDLDAIKLSNTFTDNAANVNSLSGLNVFDFSPAGTLFTPGAQRPPADPALFGTTGGEIDNAIATLSNFDANATTGPDANGFASLGDLGKVSFNLTAPISTATPLYLYIGEVGDNGEVAASQITVSDKPIGDPQSVPEPTILFGLVTMGLVIGSSLKGREVKQEG